MINSKKITPKITETSQSSLVGVQNARNQIKKTRMRRIKCHSMSLMSLISGMQSMVTIKRFGMSRSFITKMY